MRKSPNESGLRPVNISRIIPFKEWEPMPEEDKKPPKAPAQPEETPAGDSSLEETSTKTEDDSGALEKTSSVKPAKDDQPMVGGSQMGLRDKLVRKLGGINPYLVLFVLVLVLGGVVAFIANRLNNQNDPTNQAFEDGELTQEELERLRQAEQNIGTVDQTLTVAANAIFNGKILVKSDLDVAGSIRVGGPLSLPGITVAGSSEFEDINVNNDLAILGSTSIQQSLTVQGAVTINGNLSVGGTISAAAISADSVEFSGDLELSRHIDTNGGTPSASSGTAVGSGGTVSVSGNDIAGTVTINTGGSPPAGLFIRVNFKQTYSGTPVVQITPVGSSAGGLNYYVVRDSAGFNVGTSNVPAAATTYRFDYFVVE